MQLKEAVHTPINKGHFELEPQARIDAFRRKLSAGWEAGYREYRRLWEELPRRKQLRDYPLLVDLELASKCNLACPMCPTVTQEFEDKRVKPFAGGLMDFELVKRIIEEVSGHIYSLRLSWVGEPTLHPRLIDAVAYAKQHRIPEVSFLTNGSKIHLTYMKKLMDAGLDLMTVSIDGMYETYDRIRKPLRFERTLRKLTQLKQYKEEHGINKPLVKIQGVWPAISERPEEYYRTFEPLVDLIAFNPLIDYLHKDHDLVYEDGFYCPQHYQRVVIGANGKASMCSSDDFMDVDVGDANVQTIHEIWHGEKLAKVRAIHSCENGFKNLYPCARCFYPRKTEVNEEAMVKGRRILIENYVGRTQVIGK